MTVGSLLARETRRLKESGIEDAALNAELLLAHILKSTRERILMYPNRFVSPLEQNIIEQAMQRRLHHEPLAYILGVAPFFGRLFAVNAHTLIPRSETEMLLHAGISFIHAYDHAAVSHTPLLTIVDVGTGSGCIAITCALEMRRQNARQHSCIAIDISLPALDVARQNAYTHRVHDAITFHEGTLLDSLKRTENKETHMLILANLPYVCAEDMHQNIALAHEPRIALYGGIDGLDVLRGLFAQLATFASSWTLITEIDPRQHRLLMHDVLPYFFPNHDISFFPDWAGRTRLLVVNAP